MASVRLPLLVPFPVTVSTIFYKPGDAVQKHAALVKYRYWDFQDDPAAPENDPQQIRVERIGLLESPVDGHVVAVNVRVNEQITNSTVTLFRIEQKCAHAVQYGGLCALCGEAVGDEKDYTGYTAEDGATVLMAHGHTGLKVSESEAAQIEKLASQRLAAAGKLILVVDLDQTVIHATVDPTVGEWQRDVNSTNHAYVSDVRSFALEEEPVVPPGYTGPKPVPHKCWYYVKTRPGLAEFLRRISQLYELHIYTMATRNYALAIAKIIDPDGEYFGDRILSRDESGSLTHKNLKRLFPVDQSMVAIIDDRGDVWSWEANLIKVVPYDFFVGIGDINLSFLPKKNGQLVGPLRRTRSAAVKDAPGVLGAALGDDPKPDFAPSVDVEDTEDTAESAKVEADVDVTAADGKDTNGTAENGVENTASSPSNGDQPAADDTPPETADLASAVARVLEMGDGTDDASLLLSQQMTRSQIVEQQQHDRPLAKLQHDLEVSAEKKLHQADPASAPESDSTDTLASGTPGPEHLLRDDDTELFTLQTALESVHSEYFAEYHQHQRTRGTARPDLADILPRLKLECLRGTVVLFSGILPMGLSIDNADIVIWARQFGVTVVNEVCPEVTHVICRDPLATPASASGASSGVGLTLKVRVAKKAVPGVHVVTPDWLFACLSLWKKVPEADFAIELPDRDWFVPQLEVDKYLRALEARRQRAQAREQEKRASILQSYDFNDASAEVDDFLAGLSDDDEDGGDGERGDFDELGMEKPTGNGRSNTGHNQETMADEEESEEDEQVPAKPSGSAFLRGLITTQKRKAYESESEESEESEESADEHPQKRRQVFGAGRERGDSEDADKMDEDAGDFGNDMDELEKELLDELDNMDE